MPEPGPDVFFAEAIEKAGYKDKCMVGMDVAASEFKVEGEDCYDLGTW